MFFLKVLCTNVTPVYVNFWLYSATESRLLPISSATRAHQEPDLGRTPVMDLLPTDVRQGPIF